MSNNDKWMACTSCHAVVQLNATGICLGCQGGFNPLNEEDKYMPVSTEMESNEELKAREKELEDAIKKGKESEDNKLEHKNRDGKRKTPKASNRHKSIESRKKQAKTKTKS